MKKLITVLAAAVLSTTAVDALIISGEGITRPNTYGSGGFIKIVDPAGISVGMDNFNQPFLYGFDEKQGVEFGGFVFNSHYLFFDPFSPSPEIGFNMVGSVVFDTPVISIIENRATQIATDPVFGLSSVNYMYPALVGFEGTNSATVDPLNPNKILWDTNASSPGDWIRVLTLAEPTSVADSSSTLLLGAVGLSALIGIRRKRRFSKAA